MVNDNKELKEFLKNNIIQKETIARVFSFLSLGSTKDTIHKDIEYQLNQIMKNEQAEDVDIQLCDKYICLKYTRYQQYEICDDGYKATGIFHSKEMYDASRA